MNDHQSLLGADKGIIIAADVSTLDNLRRLVELCSQVHEVVAIKVGFSLALRYGLPSVIGAVNEVSHMPVIYDHQKAGTDIPAMGRPFAETCREAGVQGVIFIPMAGPITLESFISAAFDCDLTPIVGLAMTHAAYFKSESGFITDDAPELICKSAINAGVRNFVLPGNKPNTIQKLSEGLLAEVRPADIMMPGIGSQGGSIAPAFAAAKDHHPFAIIGSAIYQSTDPRAALEQFAAEVRRC